MRLTRPSLPTPSHPSLWTGARPALVGASLLALLATARLLASATPERVFFLGREFQWNCLFRRVFGLPCPACGMTRGVLLTLDGHITDALKLNPAAPLLVAGLILTAVALVFVAIYQCTRAPLAAARLHARLRLAVRAFAALLLAVMLAHWMAELLPVLVRAI